MERETFRGFENNVMEKERTDTPNNFRVSALLKKFRLALLLAASLTSGCSASYYTVRSYKKFEPVVGREMTIEIPGELTVNAEVTEGYLNINVQRNNTVKRFNRMTEREIQYEERETEKLEGDLYTALGFGVIGLGALGLAAENEGDERKQANAVGAISFGIGGLVALHSAYIALRSIDSKNVTGKTRVVDTPLSENDVARPVICPVSLRKGNHTFPLGDTDDTGNLRLTAEQLTRIIPPEQFLELIDSEEQTFVEGTSSTTIDFRNLRDRLTLEELARIFPQEQLEKLMKSKEKIFVKVRIPLPIAVDLKKMLPAKEWTAYQEYKKLDDRKKKIEMGTQFLEQYPQSLLVGKVKKQVDEFVEKERLHTAACVEWFGSHTQLMDEKSILESMSGRVWNAERERWIFEYPASCIELTPLLVERFRVRERCQEAVIDARNTLKYQGETADNYVKNRNAAEILKKYEGAADNYYEQPIGSDVIEKIEAAIEMVSKACGDLGETEGTRLVTEISKKAKDTKLKITRANIAIERFNREISRYCAKRVCVKHECGRREYYKRTKYNLRIYNTFSGYYWIHDRTNCNDYDWESGRYERYRPNIVECVPVQGTDWVCASQRCVEMGTRCKTKP